MAYITQYQADMDQNARNAQNQAAIGQGLQNAANMFVENRRRAVDAKKANDAQDFTLTSLGGSTGAIKKYRETGDSGDLLTDLGGIAKLKRETEAAAAGRAARKDESIINLNNRKAEKESKAVPKMSDKEKIDYRINKQQEQQKEDEVRKANITGYEFHSPDITPTPKDAEDVKKMNAAHTNFERTAGEIQDLVKSFSPLDYTGVTAKGKLLKQKISEAQIQQKTIKDLGVLNGPDLPLINSAIGDVGSFTSLATLGPEQAAKRMQEAVNSSRNNLHSEAHARGYKPKGQEAKQQQKQIAPEDAQAIQWARQNPNDPRAAQILQLHGAK